MMILAVIFLLHNLEEWLSFDEMPKPGIGKKIMTRKSFLFSAVLLSSLVILFSLPTFEKIHLIILFSLLINSLQHGVLSIRHRRIVPGTYTALLLIFPYSLFLLARMIQEGKTDVLTLIVNLILSPFVMGLSIVSTLFLGYYLFSNKRN